MQCRVVTIGHVDKMDIPRGERGDHQIFALHPVHAIAGRTRIPPRMVDLLSFTQIHLADNLAVRLGLRVHVHHSQEITSVRGLDVVGTRRRGIQQLLAFAVGKGIHRGREVNVVARIAVLLRLLLRSSWSHVFCCLLLRRIYAGSHIESGMSRLQEWSGIEKNKIWCFKIKNSKT